MRARRYFQIDADALLADGAEGFDWRLLDQTRIIGLSAGASAPESLVEDFLTELAARRTLRLKHIETARENIVFNTPLRLAS